MGDWFHNVLHRLGKDDKKDSKKDEVKPEEAEDPLPENSQPVPMNLEGMVLPPPDEMPTAPAGTPTPPPPAVLRSRWGYPGIFRRSEGPQDTVNCWSEIPGTCYKIRGRDYLVDHKKITSAPSVCKLVAVDYVLYNEKVPHWATWPRIGTFEELPKDAEYFIVNFQVPVAPNTLHMVLYLQLPAQETPENARALKLLRRFMSREETNEFRDSRLKMIPSIHEGPWLVKKAVGNVPCILPNKLTTTYRWGERHMEADIDVASSVAAGYAVTLVKSYVRQVEIDLALIIEAQADAELPEQILGTLRIHRTVLCGEGVASLI